MLDLLATGEVERVTAAVRQQLAKPAVTGYQRRANDTPKP